MGTYKIICYYNSSDRNVLDKTLTKKREVLGNIKQATDMIRPVITMSNDTSIDWSLINYIWIEYFHRNYFVESKTFDTIGNVTLQCVVDPLTSHAEALKTLSIIAKRSTNLYNVYQYDPEIPTLENKVVATQKFPGGFPSGEALILANNGGGIVV